MGFTVVARAVVFWLGVLALFAALGAVCCAVYLNVATRCIGDAECMGGMVTLVLLAVILTAIGAALVLSTRRSKMETRTPPTPPLQ